MLIDADIRQCKTTKKSYIGILLLLCVLFHSPSLYAVPASKQTLKYYLNISDFAQSFIEIPTSNVSVDSPTISSKYLAGRAAIYNRANEKCGTCSASFLCMQNADATYTDISNFISVDNGLIVSWFTPTTLANLELDSIVHSMVTECQVTASTKIGVNPFYGQMFNLIVSSDDEKIYFEFTRIWNDFKPIIGR
jgi:hypothetical protein